MNGTLEVLMSGSEQRRIQESDPARNGAVNGGADARLFDAYTQAARGTTTRPADVGANGANDNRFAPVEASDGGAGQGLTPTQAMYFQTWREKERAILDFNLKNDADGGAHLQNSVFQLTKQMLRAEGLDKQGWEALPVAMNSPLDKIGADIVLVNSRTGDVIFLDPTSRRLDPKTGEMAAWSDNAKTNVPALRESGVVDALPRWFERGTGVLDPHTENPEMNERIREFQGNFREQLRDLTSRPAPFNMKDFPIPSTYPVKDQAVEVQQIQKVVDWAQKKAVESRQGGDAYTAQMQEDFGRSLRNGALNFSRRTGSEAITAEMDRAVNRVIIEEALSRAYPNKFKPAAPGQRTFQRLEDGSDVRTDKGGNLIIDLKTPGQPGADQVINAGSLTESFRKATTHWAGGQYDPKKVAELYESLPKSVRKLVDSGQVKVEKIMAEIANDRNAFSAGGAGAERPFLARVVTRLANQKAEGLRRIMNGAATEVTSPVEAEVEVAPVTKPVVPEVKTPVVTEQTHLGRPAVGDNGRWIPGAAPKPQLGRVDLPAQTEALPEHLTEAELKYMERCRTALESLGSSKLGPADREQIASFKFAEQELGKPLNGDKTKIELVRHIRGLMGPEARGAALSLSIVSIAVLNFYHAHKAELDESERAKFY